MIKYIFFDMDGVLSDFKKQADKIQASSNTQFWKKVSEMGLNFWLDAEEIEGIKELVYELLARGFEVNVITKLPITDTANATEGKIMWINKHFPNTFTHIILSRGNKGLFANENSLLIDDKLSNCKDWEKYGGQSVLFMNNVSDLITSVLEKTGHI